MSSPRPHASAFSSMLCAGLALAFAGCTGSSSPTPDSPATGATPSDASTSDAQPRLIFITNSNADWWNAVEKGMLDGGKEFGCQVELRRNDSSIQGQVDKLREAATLPGVKGVAVSVLEAEATGILDAMKELQEAGIIVIAIDSDVAADATDVRRAYIGTNNLEAGKIAGKAAALVRPQGGVVDVFVGTAAAANARDRSNGFFEGAGPAFSRGDTWEDQNDLPKNQQNVQNALTRNPDLGMLLGLWSYNAPILAEELAKSPEARKKTSVVTFDLAEAAVSQLEQGNIDVSVCQNPYEMGYQGVRLLKALIQDDPKTVAEILPDGQTRDTGVRVIVPSADSPVKGLEAEVMTVDEMKSWLESKGLKCS